MPFRIERWNKLDANLVLLSTGDATLRFETRNIRELLDDQNPSIQVAEGGQVLLVHSLRHQVELSLQPARIQAVDRSDVEPFKDGYPQLLARIIAWLSDEGVTLKAYGWNFEVSCETEGDATAGRVLQALLRPDASRGARLDIIGAAVTLYYRVGEVKARLRIEPRFQEPDSKEVLASVNYHHDGQPASGVEELGQEGKALWEQFINSCSSLLTDNGDA